VLAFPKSVGISSLSGGAKKSPRCHKVTNEGFHL
jgi:hypothetical protein